MNRNLSSDHKAKIFLLPLAALLLFAFIAFTSRPVQAQFPFELNSWFDYPLVSEAPNSVHVTIHNTALTPIRILWVVVEFSWMAPGTYISSNSSQTSHTLGPDQEAQFTIPFVISANVTTGGYSMNTVVAYQVFQDNGWGGPVVMAWAGGVGVLGSGSPYSITFDPYEGRFYEALAILTLLGWYLPKSLHRGKR